ncbi:MAG: hypothetical protein ACXACY_26190 [Candidatus Hodarchaeales archaeon]|jgi:hypothetical protein
MKVQFLHISFDVKEKYDEEKLRKKFDLALDWIHYAPGCWIVRTTSSAEKWYQRIKPVVGPKNLFLIVKIDLEERYGWMPKWVWEWIKQYRKRKLPIRKKG